MSSNSKLTTSQSNNITSPPGNSLAVFLDKNKALYLKDVNGVTEPLTDFLPETPSGGGIVTLTRAEALVLKDTSSFVPGTYYCITDADVLLYGGTEVTLLAITNNQLSLSGSGKFYCPKYDLSEANTGYGVWNIYMQGEFINITGTFTYGERVTAQNGAEATYLAQGFLAYNSGDWSLATEIGGTSGTCEVSGFVSPFYERDQIVHWGGKSWINTNGNIGSSLDKYILDSEWLEIEFNETDYNVYVDGIEYDFTNDAIICRKDIFGNLVSGTFPLFENFKENGYGNPIKDFQWGCASNSVEYGIQNNKIIDSYFGNLNTLALKIFDNHLSQNSFYHNNIIDKTSVFEKNLLIGSNVNFNILISEVIIAENQVYNSFIQENTLNTFADIFGNNLLNSSIQQNILYDCYIDTNVLNDSSISSNNLVNDITILSNNLNESVFVFSNVQSSIIRCICNAFNTNNNVIDLATSTLLQEGYSKQLYDNAAGVPRLQYVNSSDAIVITDVDS